MGTQKVLQVDIRKDFQEVRKTTVPTEGKEH
jgi:hypothetical protein